MSRLHLGGGTPTLLHPDAMNTLLDRIFAAFGTASDFEFSVEIDPTEANPDLLDLLANRGLSRASIGIQDFSPKVQAAIGREQSFEQTKSVLDRLRSAGVPRVNFDLLYGLPFQTPDSYRQTLDQVLKLAPNRLAIYGYAHVPWVSKRQMMIPESALPGAEARFALAEQSREIFTGAGYDPIGIDHFALPDDGLAVAKREYRLRRNFQGYTDDPATCLIGFGASAISRFPDGYCQNAAATAAYSERVETDGLAGHRGYEMAARDHLIERLIEDIMCYFRLDPEALTAAFPDDARIIKEKLFRLWRRYRDIAVPDKMGFELTPEFQSLARIVAHQLDDFVAGTAAHSRAV